MVIEAAKGVVVCDQPELGAAVPRGAVRPNVTQNVLVSATFDLTCLKQDNEATLPEQGGRVYLRLSDPGRLVPREENLDGDGLPIPNASPNLTVPGHQSYEFLLTIF